MRQGVKIYFNNRSGKMIFVANKNKEKKTAVL